MKMRDWELIANVHGERFRELKWIESYMVEEGGCDRAFIQRILSFPRFKFSRFGEYVSELFENSSSDEERNWLSDSVIDMQEQIDPCAQEFFRLLNTPILRLVNDLALLNWRLFILWSRDNNESSRYWFARQWTLTYWQLDENYEHSRDVWAIGSEWAIPKWDSFGVSINIGGMENVVILNFDFLLSVFLYIEKVPRFLERLGPEEERELSFEIHHNTIWIDLFAEVDCWRNRDWRRIVIHPDDLLLGKERCETQFIGERPVDIHFDNKVYKATAKLEIRTWTRSRFPFLKRSRKDVRLEIEHGIPIPGKGESSYDIGDDALMGTGASSSNLKKPWDELVEESIQNAIASVQRTRLKYGGEGWESLAQKTARETGLEVIEN